MREVCINSEGQCENRFCFSSFCWDCLFGHCVYIRVHLIYYFTYSIQIVLTIIATSQQHFFIVCSSLHFDCIERKKKKKTRRKQPGFYRCPHRFEICSPTTALLCWQSLILCILGTFFSHWNKNDDKCNAYCIGNSLRAHCDYASGKFLNKMGDIQHYWCPQILGLASTFKLEVTRPFKSFSNLLKIFC